MCRKVEEAWEHLEEANRLQHATAGYSSDHENMLFDVGFLFDVPSADK